MEPKANATNGFAIAALILGILGILFWPIGPILAIVFGVIARNKIKAQGGQGRGMATAGIWLGAIGVVLGLVLTIISLVIIFKVYDDAGKSFDQSSSKQDHDKVTEDRQATNSLEGTMLPDFTPVDSVTELQIIDLQPGTGREVQASDIVTVDYTGALASTGKVFESSKDSGQTVSFPLDGVIEGWSKGLVGMKEGGTRRLLIPSAMAYGEQGSGPIPPNSALVFDVTLHKIGE